MPLKWPRRWPFNAVNRLFERGLRGCKLPFEWSEKETQEPVVAKRLEKALKQSQGVEIRRKESEELLAAKCRRFGCFSRDSEVKTMVKSTFSYIFRPSKAVRSCSQSPLGSTRYNCCAWPRTH